MSAAVRARGAGRRDLLVAGGVLGAVILGQALWRMRPAELTLRPIPGLPGYLRLQGAAPATGAAGIATLGLGAPLDLPEPDLSRLHAGGPGVPVAIFTDAQCPNCRALERRLTARPDLSITWHHLALLGPASVLAARASIAAAALGAPGLMHDLFGARAVPTRELAARLAAGHGLAPDALASEMASAETDRRLGMDAALARALGFAATPGTVFGRIAALGALSEAQIDALIEEAA